MYKQTSEHRRVLEALPCEDEKPGSVALSVYAAELASIAKEWGSEEFGRKASQTLRHDGCLGWMKMDFSPKGKMIMQTMDISRQRLYACGGGSHDQESGPLNFPVCVCACAHANMQTHM